MDKKTWFLVIGVFLAVIVLYLLQPVPVTVLGIIK